MKDKKIKRRLNKKFYILVVILIGIIFGTFSIVKDMRYKATYEYKLKLRGYTLDNITVIEKELKDSEIDSILKKEFIPFLDSIIVGKYFMFKNIDDYVSNYEEYKDNVDKLISVVNVGTHNDYYTNTRPTDISKNELMLVNKYNYLGEDYIPIDLYTISDWYSFGENSSVEKVYDQFIDMHLAAKKKDLWIIVNSSYRDFALQTEIFDDIKSSDGISYADSFVAHPGFSEHQSGYSLDLSDGKSIEQEFEDTAEFKWLNDNAHKYGFILRYPKGKDDITGFSYESWHYRYVGVECATKIKDLNITFDEYYAYFLDK